MTIQYIKVDVMIVLSILELKGNYVTVSIVLRLLGRSNIFILVISTVFGTNGML